LLTLEVEKLQSKLNKVSLEGAEQEEIIGMLQHQIQEGTGYLVYVLFNSVLNVFYVFNH
jgi:hypothetical protein